MQSIFRLPWCSDQLGAKLSDKAVLEKMRATPVLEIPVLNKLKRKQSDVSESAPSPSAPPPQPKKLRADVSAELHVPRPADSGCPPYPAPARSLDPSQAAASVAERASAHVKSHSSSTRNVSPIHAGPETSSQSSPASAFQPGIDTDAEAAAAVAYTASPALDLADGMTRLQQVIENEFNMQILLKHNELRLIEQELAKCQIALEQLRRCELRPFPGTSSLSPDVSAGTGPAVAPPPGFSRPSHPAPYGVTDGPYTQHYRRWLLQDAQFDAMSPQELAQFESSVCASGRSTRNSGTVRKFSTKPFASAARASDPLQSIPNYPSAPAKDKTAPLVLKRSTDGQLVKLICNNCHRGNFSSIQGFLNHCRIAHKVDYKSHDLAAIDCGRLLDEGELASLPAETHVGAPKPTATRSSTAVSTSSTHTPAKNLVHPLNTAVGAASALSTPVTATPVAATPVPSLGSPAPQQFGSVPFKASSQVPRLSAYFAKNQLGGDLDQAIFRAKQKCDFYSDEEPMSPQTPDTSLPATPIAGGRTLAGASQTSAMLHGPGAAQPQSRKGYRQPTAQRSRPSPLAPPGAFAHGEIVHSPHDNASAASLSPHMPDSNPGLVSDHEDDDHGSASEEESPHGDIAHPPLPGVARTCGDPMEIDVADDEELGQHGVIIRRNSMLASEARGLGNAGSPSRKLGLSKGGK